MPAGRCAARFATRSSTAPRSSWTPPPSANPWWSVSVPLISRVGRDESLESLGWSLPLESHAWSFVEQCGDVVELALGVDGQIGAFGEELADKAVPVLVAAALPG